MSLGGGFVKRYGVAPDPVLQPVVHILLQGFGRTIIAVVGFFAFHAGVDRFHAQRSRRDRTLAREGVGRHRIVRRIRARKIHAERHRLVDAHVLARRVAS